MKRFLKRAGTVGCNGFPLSLYLSLYLSLFLCLLL